MPDPRPWGQRSACSAGNEARIRDCLKWGKGEGSERARDGRNWRAEDGAKAVAAWSKRQGRSMSGGVARGHFKIGNT